MKKVYVFLATGFEEIEAFTPVDILRRAEIDVQTISILGSRYVESAHGVVVKADNVLRESDLSDATMLILPGGMPSAKELAACHKLGKVLISHNDNRKLIGAICAAPMVLGQLGLLRHRRATCYPGFEGFLEGAQYTANEVEKDDNIITACGPGAAMTFSFTLLEHLTERHVVKAVSEGMIVKK